MLVTSVDKPDVVELTGQERLVVSSTYEMVKRSYDLATLKSVKLKVYDGFFVAEFEDRSGKPRKHAFSDTWDFSVE